MTSQAGGTRERPLSFYLARLIWLCMLPLLAVAIWLAVVNVNDVRHAQQREGQYLATSFATAVDQHLKARIRALNLLAESPLLDQPEHWPQFYHEAVAFREQFGSEVILADSREPMRMLLHTRLPFGSELPALPRPEGVAAVPLALATLHPAVGDRFVGPVVREPMVAVAVPVLRPPKVPFVLLTPIGISKLQTRLESFALPRQWVMTVRDSRGETIVRRAPPDVAGMTESDPEARFVASSEFSPWSIVVEIPRQVYRAPLVSAAWAIGVALLAATMAGMAGAIAGSRRIGAAVASLAGPVTIAKALRIKEISAARGALNDASLALRESEELFRRLFDQAPLAMAHVARDGAIIALNRRFVQLLGYGPEDLPTISEWWERAYPDPHSRALVTDAWNAAVENAARDSGDVEPREVEVRSKDGRILYVEISGIVMADGLLASLTDLTDRRRAEKELRSWAETFQRSALALAIADTHSNTFVAVNPAFAQQRGYQPDELVGQPVLAVYPAELAADVRTRIAAIDESSHGVFESEHVGKDGRRFPVLMDVTVLRNQTGEHELRVAYALDLTERKRAEQELARVQAEALEQQNRARIAALNQMLEANAAQARAEEALAALRESEERLTLFIEHAPAALAMFDRQMRYLAASERWRSDYRLGKRELIGKSHYDIFPEIGEDWKAVHRRGLDGEVVRAEADRFVRADGTVQCLRWEVRPWYAASGEVGGIVIFAEDITAQKLAEDEIRGLTAGLERRVEERTAELSAANRELDAFAYAVSHDLRAPLRAMSGFSQALREDYGSTLPGEARLFLEQIGIASHRMNELIEGILALSRSTRGELVREQVDLSALASRHLEELAQADRERHVAWEVEPGLTACGDPRMLDAALTNLLDNAWKYTAGSAAPSIRVFSEQEGGRVWFCVQDNGAGFDMAHSGRLFQPFQRLHRQDEFPGIGIGLATVQRIVRRHGGEIRANGTRGAGATFSFTLM